MEAALRFQTAPVGGLYGAVWLRSAGLFCVWSLRRRGELHHVLLLLRLVKIQRQGRDCGTASARYRVMLHHIGPSARKQLGRLGREIGLGHRPVELRLRGRLVASREQLLGLSAIRRTKAFGTARGFVSRVKLSPARRNIRYLSCMILAPTPRAWRIMAATVTERWQSFSGAAAEFCQSSESSRKSGRISAQNDVTRSSSF